MIRSAVLGAVVLAAGLLSVSSIAQSLAPIPGTRVSMTIPENFEIARDFSGLMWRDAATSIVIVELPGPTAEMQASFTKDALASKGMALRSAEQVQSAMGSALLLHVSQVAQGTEFLKWMLVGGNESTSVLLTATVPATLASQLEPTLRQALMTARWEPGRKVDPRAAIGFSVEETADLKFSSAMAGSALLLTRGGAPTMSAPTDPVVIVARSTSEVAITDLSAFAKRRLNETQKISNIAVQQEAGLELGGMPAYELVAAATLEPSIPVVVYQALAFDGRHYYVMHCRFGVEHRERYLDQCRQIARSLRTKPGN